MGVSPAEAPRSFCISVQNSSASLRLSGRFVFFQSIHAAGDTALENGFPEVQKVSELQAGQPQIGLNLQGAESAKTRGGLNFRISELHIPLCDTRRSLRLCVELLATDAASEINNIRVRLARFILRLAQTGNVDLVDGYGVIHANPAVADHATEAQSLSPAGGNAPGQP